MGIYIHIYIYIYTYRSGSAYPFLIWQRDCSTSPPNVGAFCSNNPHCWLCFGDRSYEHVPHDRGIILCFRWHVAFDLSFTNQVKVVWENTYFNLYCLFAKIHHRELWKRLRFFEKGSHCLPKAFICLERGAYCLRFPLWKSGGLDSASGANKVAR